MNPVLREQFEKGINQGKEEGFHYGRIETAKNMLERGVDSEFISEVTGLSLEDIKKLK
jgi:predicted transposase/invertase (TIGR01784 family)